MSDPMLLAAAVRARSILEVDRRTILECNSLLGADLQPIPGTLDPWAALEVAELDDVIAQLGAAIERARPATAVVPIRSAGA